MHISTRGIKCVGLALSIVLIVFLAVAPFGLRYGHILFGVEAIKSKRDAHGNMTPALAAAVLRESATEDDIAAVIRVSAGSRSVLDDRAVALMNRRFTERASKVSFNDEEVAYGFHVAVYPFTSGGNAGKSNDRIDKAVVRGQHSYPD